MIAKSIDDINIGLVLSGGGSKGAYEAGVFKAIRELDIAKNISVISGTSIGTVNGLMFSMNDNNVIESSWASVSYSRFILNEDSVRDKKMSYDIKRIYSGEKSSIKNHLARQEDIGLLSQLGVRQFIEEYINMNVIKKSGRTIYDCAYNINLGYPEYFKLNDYTDNEVIDITLASCAIPFIFKPIQFNGYKYADGGIISPKYTNKNIDNVPIKPVIKHNCDIIIVIYLSHKDKIDKQVLELKQSLSKKWAKSIIGYSFKTNNLPWLIGYMRSLGLWAEVVFSDEYNLAKSLGYLPERIIFNGPVKGKEEFIDAVENNAIVNIDSHRELEWLLDCKSKSICNCNIGLRVNFCLENYCPGETQCGKEDGRFGFSLENGELDKAIKFLEDNNIPLSGLHLHCSSKTRSLNIYRSIAQVASNIIKSKNLNLKYMDVGGGFFGGMPEKPSFDDYCNVISGVLKENDIMENIEEMR